MASQQEYAAAIMQMAYRTPVGLPVKFIWREAAYAFIKRL
jgi:hypothetical protein